jgi:hypothetical protein
MPNHVLLCSILWESGYHAERINIVVLYTMAHYDGQYKEVSRS